MNRALLLALLLLASHHAAAQHYLPDPDLAPGMIDPTITQDNLMETVCVPGWTHRVRPSSAYIRQLKRADVHSLNLPGTAADYHLDHRVPLCAGGHPSDPKNLWPQPLKGQWRDADKNQLEASVCQQLCRGDITLEQAQSIFLAPDWTQEYKRYFAPPSTPTR